MDIQTAKLLLYTHSELRAPRFGPETQPSEKVERLEDFMAEAAVARGNLEEARLWVDHARFLLDDDWGKIEGWEHLIPNASKATGPQIAEAKRRVKPDIYDAIREAKWVVSKLADQIRRLEKDEESTSRRYTIITGS